MILRHCVNDLHWFGSSRSDPHLTLCWMAMPLRQFWTKVGPCNFIFSLQWQLSESSGLVVGPERILLRPCLLRPPIMLFIVRLNPSDFHKGWVFSTGRENAVIWHLWHPGHPRMTERQISSNIVFANEKGVLSPLCSISQNKMVPSSSGLTNAPFVALGILVPTVPPKGQIPKDMLWNTTANWLSTGSHCSHLSHSSLLQGSLSFLPTTLFVY